MATVTPGESVKKATPRRFHFYLNGKRQSIRFPKLRWNAAQGVLHRIEDLVIARKTNTNPKPDTANWLAELDDDDLKRRMAQVGLIEAPDCTTLGMFLDEYLPRREKEGTAESTMKKFRSLRESLYQFFGRGKLMRDITKGDAIAWRRSLTRQRGGGENPDEPLAENTKRERTKVAKTFFNAAIEQGILQENPFNGLAASVQENREREHFIPADQVEQIFQACPNPEWRVIFALCRFGGLRCPSEVTRLRWENVDWKRKRMKVWSSKTKQWRTVPIFPELWPHLRQAYQRPERGEKVVNRKSSCNLGTHFNRIVKKAELEPWKKPFNNLRSTRETELMAKHPLHVVCKWLGNSPGVASRHYLQVTEEDFAKATGLVEGGGAPAGALKTVSAGIDDSSNCLDNANIVQNGAQPSTAVQSSAPSRTRTLNLLIKSQ